MGGSKLFSNRLLPELKTLLSSFQRTTTALRVSRYIDGDAADQHRHRRKGDERRPGSRRSAHGHMTFPPLPPPPSRGSRRHAFCAAVRKPRPYAAEQVRIVQQEKWLHSRRQFEEGRAFTDRERDAELKWARQQRQAAAIVRQDIARAKAAHTWPLDDMDPGEASKERAHTPSIEYQLLRGFALEAEAAEADRRRQQQQRQDEEHRENFGGGLATSSASRAAQNMPKLRSVHERWSILRALADVEQIYADVQSYREKNPTGVLLRETDAAIRAAAASKALLGSIACGEGKRRRRAEAAAASQELAAERVRPIEGPVHVQAGAIRDKQLLAVPLSMPATATARQPFGVIRIPDAQYQEALRKAALAGFHDLQQRARSPPKSVGRANQRASPGRRGGGGAGASPGRRSVRTSVSLPTLSSRLGAVTPPAPAPAVDLDAIEDEYEGWSPPSPTGLPYEQDYQYGSLLRRLGSDA